MRARPDNHICDPHPKREYVYIRCPECDGRGFVEQKDGDGYGGEVTCTECFGRGGGWEEKLGTRL